MFQRQRSGRLVLLVLLSFALQGCLGFGGSGTKTIGTNSSGNQVSVVQNVFAGKIYATIGHNLYQITGAGQSRMLEGGGNIYDPSVSPDGTKIAFIQRYDKYSNLVYSSINGGPIHVLLNGNGKFLPNSLGFIHASYHWFFEPAWALDGNSLIFLSDLMKMDYALQAGNQDADMLDLQVFSASLTNPLDIQAVAYAQFGGGGDSDPSYRPGYANQILYSHYSALPGDASNQVVQLFMADPGGIARNPGKYFMNGLDTGVAISATHDEDIQPAFSRDGKFIAYIKRDSATKMSLNIMPVPENVTQDPNDAATEKLALLPYQKSVFLQSGLYMGRPIWSPGDKQIGYMTENNESLDLWVMKLHYDAQSGSYLGQGSPVQVTIAGIDGDSRIDWTN